MKPDAWMVGCLARTVKKVGKVNKVNEKQIYINVGNSRISAGYFKGGKLFLLGSWPSLPAEVKKIKINKNGCERIILASVVPGISRLLKKKYPGRVCEIKNKDVPVKNLYRDKESVGVDRLLACLGALKKYKRSCVVVDFGTATTLNLITKNGEFKGGIIAPGAGMFSDYLYEKTSKLPGVTLKPVKRAIGKSTDECIGAGIFFGNLEMVGGLIRRVKKEVKGKIFTAATGGWGSFFFRFIKEIDIYDPGLVFYGMRSIKGK